MTTPRVYDNSPLHVFSNNMSELASGQATITGATTLRAANALRRAITIKALTGGGTLYVGQSGLSTTDGYEVKGGESLTLNTTAAIYVNASASTDVRWIETLVSA